MLHKQKQRKIAEIGLKFCNECVSAQNIMNESLIDSKSRTKILVKAKR